MTVPLVVLAFFSVVAGFLGVPEAIGGSNRFIVVPRPVARRGAPARGHPPDRVDPHGPLGRRRRSPASSSPGAGTARPGPPPQVPSAQANAFYLKTGVLGRLVENRWFVDEGIEAGVLAPFRKIGTFLWRGFDSLVIDGVVNASAFLVELTGDLVRFFTTGNVRNYALSFTLGVLALAIYVFLR